MQYSHQRLIVVMQMISKHGVTRALLYGVRKVFNYTDVTQFQVPMAILKKTLYVKVISKVM